MKKQKANRKFIPWEIEQALNRELPIIVVNINNARNKDDARCPNSLKDVLAIHIPFKSSIIQYAFNNWPSSNDIHKSKGDSGSYVYKDEVYKSLGL